MNKLIMNKYLEVQNISEVGELYEDLISRVCERVAKIEKSNFDHTNDKFIRDFYDLCEKQMITLGSPILMSIGKDENKSIASCAAIELPKRNEVSRDTLKVIEEYYINNLGAGFNLSEFDNPVELLKLLNKHADKVAADNMNIRHIGNIAILDYNHNAVYDYIKCKQSIRLEHFNLSINVANAFCTAYKNGNIIEINGNKTSAADFINALSESIYYSAEPGIVFLDRINQKNTVPSLGKYYVTSPCAEIGLAYGDLCMFGYIDISSFFNDLFNKMDYDELRNAVNTLIHILDDCIEIQLASSFRYNDIIRKKRRVAIGVCGYADLLEKMDVVYGSDESIKILRDVLLFINYTSKRYSMELSQKRGFFDAYPQSLYCQPDYLTTRFGAIQNLLVSQSDWKKLDSEISNSGVRNSTTMAIPPSAGAAYILGASPSIEPHFAKNINHKKKVLTAIEILPVDHLRVLDTASQCIDESVSKTINLRESCTQDQISEILKLAMDFENITGVALYRDKSLAGQPETIS